MGNWNINIQGVGQHHNDKHEDPAVKDRDANRLFQKFVADLKALGHNINHATFTYGAAEDAKGAVLQHFQQE